MWSDDYELQWVILLPPLLGILWAMVEAYKLSRIKLEGPLGNDDKHLTDPLYIEMGSGIEQQLSAMKNIARFIAEGSDAFLFAEMRVLIVYVLVFGLILAFVISALTSLAFVVGCLTSILCCYVGMKVAVYANIRVCHESWVELKPGFQTALLGGSVIGFTLVSIGILTLSTLILIFKHLDVYSQSEEKRMEMFEALAGYGLGGSSIALFARVGGGIYTKAADVGADLSGKNDYGMSEDDPRNPACIADNVGDNVGDVAGMGADLFGSFAEATCAAFIVASAALIPGVSTAGEVVPGLGHSWSGLMFPLIISSSGILTGILTLLCVRACMPVRSFVDVENCLKAVLFVSTILETPVVIGVSYMNLPSSFALNINNIVTVCAWWHASLCVLLGLWSGLLIGVLTEYYTSHTYSPVREIAESQKVSAATGIIYGLALGYESTIVPTLCLAVTVCVSHSLCGNFGVAISALGMLSTLSVGLTIDSYGPISDNAGGIAEMAGLGGDVRARTDALDAAGNTTAAIGKGYAIGSAALVSLALFGAYCVRSGVNTVDVSEPWTFAGLCVGAMLPYAFSGMCMKSVGRAASDMVAECLRQFPLILQGNIEPQYTRCIDISTRASLKEMIAPGALVIISPIAAGMLFGRNCTAGLLAGALVSGIQLAISSSNSGGAWDNSKKYVESGALGLDHKKGSQTHKNSVTGDTVGDPMKDTSGPSLNILVKLSAIISLVFGSFISNNFSNANGGPIWM